LKVGRQVAAIAAALTFVAGTGASERPNEVWEFNVASALRDDGTSGSGGALGVFALSFSPDGRHIAAAVGSSLRDERLLIIETAKPQEGSRTADTNPDGSEHIISTELSWSSSGQQILFGRKAIQLSNRSTCVLPERLLLPPFVFAKPGMIAARQSPLVYSESGTWVRDQYRPIRLSEFNLDCRNTAEVDLGSDVWSIYDASPERGTLLLYWQHQQAINSIEWALSLVDAAAGRVLRKVPLLERAKFADSGKTVCGVGGKEWHRTVECIDADSGKQIALIKGWRNPYIETARCGKRVILSDFGREFDWSDLVWREGGPLRKRVLWDFGTGKVLATWRSKRQKVPVGASPDSDFQYAISPDGNYVAEGGAGVVTLYRIGG
jgi:WD40 repeat protein